MTLPDLTAQTITWPMTVNVVRGDEAAGRLPEPSVTTARLLAEANSAKLDARLIEEDEPLEKLAREAEQQDAVMASKSLMEDYSMSSRGRSDKVRRDGARSKRQF